MSPEPLKIVRAEIHFQTMVNDGQSIEFTYCHASRTLKCHRDFLDEVDVQIASKIIGLLPDSLDALTNLINSAVTAGDAWRGRKLKGDA